MIKNFPLLILLNLFIVASCSTTPGLKPRGVEDYYISTGVEKYFLSDIPDWANFSQSAGCFRLKGLRYFDVDALMKSYALTFFEALQLQGSFNEEYAIIKTNQARESLTLKEEENLFFKASEKVSSKIYYNDLPAFKQIHLIWVDEVIGNIDKENKLKTFLQSSVHNEGVPVLVSACLNREAVEKMVPDASYKILSAEVFTVYDKTGVRKPSLHLDLTQFFKADQKLFFYTQNAKRTIEDIKGNFKVLNY